MKPIKILFITHCLEMYGANSAVVNLMLDLKERYNVEAYVIIPQQEIVQDAKTIVEILEANDIGYCRVPMDFFRTSFIGQDKLHILYYKIRKYFRNHKYLEEYNKKTSFVPDIIYSNSSVIDLGILLASKMNKPHIWHIRESEKSLNLQYVYPKSIVRKLFSKSASVIAISKYIQQVECKEKGIRCSCQIYDGVKICSPYDKVYYHNQVINYAVVGNLIKTKRQMDVIKAVKILKDKGYKNFRVYFLGDGEERSAIEDEIVHLDIGDIVKLCGFVRDTQLVLRDMDVGIMASDYEGFGLATVEYMMNYMPVIGNNTGATSELIGNKAFGFLYQLGDVNGLADNMEKLMSMNYDIVQLGSLARIEAEQFTVENNTDKVYEEIERILNKFEG